jgi:acyl-CoA reductase-like NAD-dependent aldehyde dehydrogenase
MTDRLEVAKTYKLFIGGAFPRSESGRSIPVTNAKGRVLAHISHASRKDLRDAVEAARKAQSKWADATAYNRGQVLYRMAEMLEGKKAEFAGLIGGAAGKKEVEAAIDRLVCFGGWADKYAQMLGCNNPVAGPFYNFTVPEPTGVVGVIAPDAPGLLGLVSLIAPPLCSGNAVVALAGESNPLIGAVFGEVCATSDIPAGVVNILTGRRDELALQFATHRDIDAIHAAGLTAEQATTVREGTADNLKRVYIHRGARPKRGTKTQSSLDWFDDDRFQSPWLIEPFVEMKTMWHPSGA